MKCPICKKTVEDTTNRPFCSARCKQVDLGKWFTGAYAVPSQRQMEEEEAQELVEKMSGE